MRLFGKVNNVIDNFDRAQYMTILFDLPFSLQTWVYVPPKPFPTCFSTVVTAVTACDGTPTNITADI